MKNAKRSLILLLALWFTAPLAWSQQNPQVANNTRALNTAEQAVARVYEYTGFEELRAVKGEKAEEIATLTVVETDDTPFLYKEVEGRQVWKVKLENVDLRMPDRWDPDMIRVGGIKTYTALVDAETGVLYRVYSRLDHDDPSLAPEPSGEDATAQFEAMQQIFTRFLKEPPPIALREALHSASGSNPLMAKELIAYCVMSSYLGEEEVPIWSIMARGIPPIMPNETKIATPIYMENRWRSEVSAIDGKLLSVGNSPRVKLREEDRKRIEEFYRQLSE